MKIPKRFKLFSSIINIEYHSDELSNISALGDCSYIDNQIRLCSVYKGSQVTDSSITDTFYHEKVHVILDSMGEHELSKNEKFVEVFSKLLRQSIDTEEFI